MWEYFGVSLKWNRLETIHPNISYKSWNGNSLEIQHLYYMEKKAYHYPTKNMTFLVPIPLHHFRWPKSFFHDLANACVRYANKWLHLCPFVCLYTLFILSYCRVALETNVCPHLLLLINSLLRYYEIIFF